MLKENPSNTIKLIGCVMRHHFLLFFLLLFALMTSCKKNVGNKIAFDKEISLTGIDCPVEGLHMAFPHRVTLHDSLLIVMDLHGGGDKFFHAVKYDGFKYLGSFGQRGSGPNEILLATPFSIVDESMMALDGASCKMLRYPINDLFNPESVRVVPMPEKISATTIDFSCVDTAHFLLGDLTAQCRFIDMKATGAVCKFAIPQLASKDGQPEVKNLGFLWRGYMAYSPEKEILAMATQHGEVIELYNLRDSSSRVLTGEGGAPVFQADSPMSVVEGFCDIQWVGDEIYALYSGRLRAELDKEMQQLGKQPPSGGKQIYVFNAAGEPVVKYLLDRFIDGFAVDQTNRQIIGITPNGENPLCLFKL